jgi:hypothetical protein
MHSRNIVSRYSPSDQSLDPGERRFEGLPGASQLGGWHFCIPSLSALSTHR